MVRLINKSGWAVCIALALWGCNVSKIALKTENKTLPADFTGSRDTTNTSEVNWNDYFDDPHLVALIDTALKHNQELNITLQEIEIAKNEVMEKKGEYLPFVNIGAGIGGDKEGRFTRHGAVDEAVEMEPGREIPKFLGDFQVKALASWELDIWKKLRNAKSAAALRYLASVEGRNFMVTNLVKEIARSYYELMALDNQLAIIEQNIGIQQSALHVVRQQKEAAKETQLAVNRFEAQLLHTQNLQYDIRQQIVETENRINFLVGRFPGHVERAAATFGSITPDSVYAGVPSQLLANRPDIRQAERELEAAKLDVAVARANFYPSIGLRAGIGLQAFNPAFLVKPESVLLSLAGDLMAPLVNRNAIKARYNSASARQIQAVFNYERTILNAYVEVVNQLSKIDNTRKSYTTKAREVDILAKSVPVSNNLFRSARADYMEVLLTQREALEVKMELIEIKLKQLNSRVDLYQALGGGWK